MDITPALSDLPPDFMTQDDGPLVVRTIVALTVVAVLAVSVRFSVRWRSIVGFGIDDWLILASQAILFVYMAIGILAVHRGGIGKHMVTNMIEDPERFNRGTLYLFITVFLYFTLIALVKASILAMYCRIFPTNFMKKGATILGIAVAMWWFAAILVNVFQCNPVHKVYNPFIPGVCINTSHFHFGSSVPNIIQEVFILALPTHEVLKLKMRVQQKLAIAGVFLLGMLVVIFSCIRLKALLDLEVQQANITMAEAAVAIVTASLPTMRPLVHCLVGRRFASKSSKERNNGEEIKSIITIGGGKARGGFAKAKRGAADCPGAFQPLGDERPDSLRLFPEGYPAGPRIVVYGNHGSGIRMDQMPLDSIAVHRDMSWTESRM
ncbi:hypothetical protein MFIFM68171_00852 [Madurella fahalii]|uniref:Rhodopsin domain-containing protein n=1 Tax=Madurella fahalii TaxID=1157608 RepID=A0ABQ0FYQ6_9PEZI